MNTVQSISTAQDADAQYILNKIASAERLEAEAKTCTKQCQQDRIDAGRRLIEVNARLVADKSPSATSWNKWLEQNGINKGSAHRLMALVTDTPEARAEKKAKDAERKRAERAAVKSANATLKDAGVPEGGARVAIQNQVAEETGIRSPKTPEESAAFAEAARAIIAAKRTTLADTRAEIATLPETKQQQFARLEATLRRQLEAEFNERVRKAAEKKVPELIAELAAERAECRVQMEYWKHRRDGIKSQLTEAEYRLIRQTIASDRYPEEFRPKLDKIAAIINRFSTYVEAWSDGTPRFRM